MDEKILDKYFNKYKDIGDKYERAGSMIAQYRADRNLVYEETEEEIQSTFDEFNYKFSPEKLKQLTSENILNAFYLENKQNTPTSENSYF